MGKSTRVPKILIFGAGQFWVKKVEKSYNCFDGAENFFYGNTEGGKNERGARQAEKPHESWAQCCQMAAITATFLECVKICGHQSSRERLLEGKMAVIWPLLKLVFNKDHSETHWEQFM
jgi:hypothetical protein